MRFTHFLASIGAVLGLGAPACSSSNSSVPNVCIPVTEAPEGGMVSDGGAGLLLDGSCVVVVGGGPPVEPGQSSVSGGSGSVAGSGAGTLPGGGTSGAIGISGDDGGFGSSGNIGSSGLGSTGSSGVGSSGSTGSSGLGSSGSGLGSSGSIGGVGTIGGIGSSGSMAVLWRPHAHRRRQQRDMTRPAGRWTQASRRRVPSWLCQRGGRPCMRSSAAK